MIRLLIAALASALLLAGCGSTDQTGAPVTGIRVSDDDGYSGVLLDEPYALPDVPLTDTSGKPFDLVAQTRRTLVFFGYTKCPDICQVVMSTIASGMAKLTPEERAKLQVVFVTTDPPRDTRAVLRTYLDRFDPSYIGLTGSIDQIDELGKSMSIYVKKGAKLPGGGYEVDHTAAVIGVHSGSGDIVWTAATSPAQIAGDLTKILKADS
ncbi:MAG: SCO family protein [Marmoricola sp.]